MYAKRYVRMRAPHQPDPFEQKRLPQADLTSNSQNCAVSFRYRDLLFCTLPQLYECRSVAKELFARGGEGCTGLITNEKRSPELLLKETHPCADRCLCDVQAVGGFDEAPGGDDLYESPGELDVHGFIAYSIMTNVNEIRLSALLLDETVRFTNEDRKP